MYDSPKFKVFLVVQKIKPQIYVENKQYHTIIKISESFSVPII